jgi:hypothetical protein
MLRIARRVPVWQAVPTAVCPYCVQLPAGNHCCAMSPTCVAAAFCGGLAIWSNRREDGKLLDCIQQIRVSKEQTAYWRDSGPSIMGASRERKASP